MKSYRTVRTQAEALYVVKHSKFIATVVPIDDYEHGLRCIADLKKQYADATHNCYAMIADEVGLQCKYSDDGEPSGTAGAPMLEVLRRRELGHILVVVTRYFGGIKLGANGLVGACTTATTMGLDSARYVQMIPSVFCRIQLDYSLGGKLPNYVQSAGGVVLDTQYTDGVCADVVLPQDACAALQAALVEYSKGTVRFAQQKTDYWGY